MATSPKVASKAAKELESKRSTAAERSVAGSALRQTARQSSIRKAKRAPARRTGRS